MIVEKTAAKKTLAVVLALALFGGAPVGALAQVTRTGTSSAANAASYLPGAIGTLGAGGASISQVVTIPNLSLSISAPALSAAPSLAVAVSPMSLQVAAPVSVIAAQPVVERHPVVKILNDLQAKGIQLPESLSSREDAAKLIAAAQAMPEGSAKQNMMSMAQAIIAANKGGVGSTPELGKIYDAAGARGGVESTPVQATGWAGWANRNLPKPIARLVGGGSSSSSPSSSQPANRADFAVKVADMRYVPSVNDLPETTAMVSAADQQIVGQDGALKAIEFGARMPGRHYNMFVSGPEGSGRETALRHVLAKVAASMPTPGDLVAATNFAQKDKPMVLELAPGMGPVFVKGVKKFVAMMKQILPEALEAGEIGQAKKELIAQVQASGQEREEAFQAEVKQIVLSGGIGVEFFAQPSGEGQMTIGLKLMHEGKAIDPEKVDELISAGKFTREQFDAATKERDAKFPEILEKFKAMMEQTHQEMVAVQEQISQLEKQAVAQVVQTVGAPLMKLVGPQAAENPAMADLQKRFEAWDEDFSKRLAGVDIEGFGVAFMPTGKGMAIAYTFQGKPLSPDAVAQLIQGGALTEQKWAGIQDSLKKAVKPFLEEFKSKHAAFGAEQQELQKNAPKAKITPEQAKAVAYVKMLLGFSAQNHEIFLGRPASPADEDGEGGVQEAPGQKPIDAQDFFEVSALSNNGAVKGAPVVWVKNPTYENIFGEADDNRRTMIIPGVGLMKGGAPGGPSLKGGAIQQANGGYLVINVMDALREPGVWQSLMQAVRSGEAEIADDGLRGLMMGKGSTYHVPSKVKVVLIGSPSLRMMIAAHDPDFSLNFQSVADFESTLKISDASISGYVAFFKKAVVSLAFELQQDVMDLTKDAMSALVEHGARLADSNKKLTAQFGALYGTIREATYWAQQAGRKEVRREDVETALQAKQDREETYRRHLIDVYKQNVFVVETSGAKVGQINGLAVMGSFGVPMRITVVPSAAAGASGIISVDRQAGPEQTGTSFNKALGVVEGFLQNLFAQKKAFPARLSISYEQNYGGIDGDSATTTEMYAILSALSGVPIGQNFAVTGSADQFGNVQAIGGVNHKIEGFYELCKSRGLTGDQGIVIPRSNVADLQLSPEVVQAVKDGKFHIYAVDHVSQGLEILTGVAYSEIVAKAQANLAEMGKPASRKNK